MVVGEEMGKVIAAQAGDSAAAAQLAKAYMPLIKHAAALVNKCRRYELYDDAFGTAQLAFWRCVIDFDAERDVHFGAYAKLRIVGAVKDLLRYNKVRDELPLEYAENESVPPPEENCIDGLTFTDREQQVMHLLNAGYKEKEIARLLRRSQQSVSKTRLRLKAKIKAVLAN